MTGTGSIVASFIVLVMCGCAVTGTLVSGIVQMFIERMPK